MQNEVKLFSKIKKKKIHIYCQFSLFQKLNSRVFQGTIQGPGVQNPLINVKKKWVNSNVAKFADKTKKFLLIKSEDDRKLSQLDGFAILKEVKIIYLNAK